MLVLENLNYMGGFHLWPTLYFYWIAVALRFNNSFSLVETVYWKEKKNQSFPGYLQVYGLFLFLSPFCQITSSGEFVFPLDSPHKKPYEGLILGRVREKAALLLR